MRTLKRLLLSFCIVAVTLAASTHAYAIGFNAEEKYNSIFIVYSGNSLGSGFAIGENCIITNAHVIENDTQIYIGTYNGDVFPSFLVSIEPSLDIAVLGVSDVSLVPIVVADLDTVNIGDDVYAIGAPNSLAYTLTKGVVSSKNRSVGRQAFIQTDAAINTGNSGGPLLNDGGAVIGVNSYKISNAEGIGLAIPIDTVTRYLRDGNIELSNEGNVIGLVHERTPDTSTEDNEVEDYEPVTQKSVVLIIGLIFSVALNFVMIAILCIDKKRRNNCRKAQSERTDFDIEFYN